MPTLRSNNRRSLELATRMVQLGMATPEVIVRRVTQMWTAGFSPTTQDRRELDRMCFEKVIAFQQSWAAMAAEIAGIHQRNALSWLQLAWQPWTAHPVTLHHHAVRGHRDALAVLSSGLAPVHRRAVANAKRLSRTSLR